MSARSLVLFCRILPIRIGLFLGERLGALAFHLLRREREKTIRHLGKGFPEWPVQRVRETAKGVFRHVGTALIEVIRLKEIINAPTWRFDIVGREELEAAFHQGRGVVIVTGHIGNWELLAAYTAKLYDKVGVIARENPNPLLDGILTGIRRSCGVMEVKRSARPASIRPALKSLKEGYILGVAIDQDTRVEGVFVDFFGEPTHTPKAPVVLSRRTGAVPIVAFAERTAWNRHRFTFRKVCADADISEREELAVCSRMLEEQIRKAPTQWVWMHNRWKTKPRKENA